QALHRDTAQALAGADRLYETAEHEIAGESPDAGKRSYDAGITALRRDQAPVEARWFFQEARRLAAPAGGEFEALLGEANAGAWALAEAALHFRRAIAQETDPRKRGGMRARFVDSVLLAIGGLDEAESELKKAKDEAADDWRVLELEVAVAE